MQAATLLATSVSAVTSSVASYVVLSSVSLVVVTFVLGVVISLFRKSNATLEDHLIKAMAAGAIPTAIVLIYGALDPSIIAQLSGLNVAIAAAGLALLYISVKTIVK
jgi:hypothetical protein